MVTTSCSHDISAEMWVDYFAGELVEADSEAVEEALFGCDQCAREAERWGQVAGGASVSVPAVISATRLAAMEARNEPMVFNPMKPGEHKRAGFPDDGFLLVHRLGGLDFGDAERVDLTALSADGDVLFHMADVPFDPAGGEVIIACQRHFGEVNPAFMTFRVEAKTGKQTRALGDYRIDHVW